MQRGIILHWYEIEKSPKRVEDLVFGSQRLLFSGYIHKSAFCNCLCAQSWVCDTCRREKTGSTSYTIRMIFIEKLCAHFDRRCDNWISDFVNLSISFDLTPLFSIRPNVFTVSTIATHCHHSFFLDASLGNRPFSLWMVSLPTFHTQRLMCDTSDKILSCCCRLLCVLN